MTSVLHHSNKTLKEAVLRAVVFFDLFNYPLSTRELWQYLDRSATFFEVQNVLVDLMAKKIIQEQSGFFFLKGRREIIISRRERYSSSVEKISIARFAAKLLSYLPWVKMVALGNSIGSHNWRQEGDIDLLIMVKERRVWLVRFLAATITKIFNLRPRPGNEENKICLSFFVSDQDLNFKKFCYSDKDVYFHYWLANLLVLYSRSGIYRKFVGTNAWLKKHLPNWRPGEISYRYRVRNNFTLIYRLIRFPYLRHFFDYLEKKSQTYQWRFFPLDLKKKANKGTEVVLSPGVLKLHVNDRRQEYAERFALALEKIKSKI
ncbi:MAG: hypothetical protein MUF50_02495 [Planctomycetes bacterium]|jgi:hypothetical protein|nr:hypothetical protein [Planctomycetota bacterium]